MAPALRDTVDSILKSSGFRRKASTWYAEREETVLVVNLQRSKWSARYYLNLAVWLNAVAPAETLPPKEQQCHVRQRLGASSNDRLEEALDLESERVGEADRVEIPTRALRDVVVPFLNRCATLDGLREAHRAGELRGGMVHRDARRIMGGER